MVPRGTIRQYQSTQGQNRDGKTLSKNFYYGEEPAVGKKTVSGDLEYSCYYSVPLSWRIAPAWIWLSIAFNMFMYNKSLSIPQGSGDPYISRCKRMMQKLHWIWIKIWRLTLCLDT